MIHQYDPQRFRSATLRGKPVRIGTIPIGTIVELRDGRAIVQAWLPRRIGAGRRTARGWEDAFIARGGHLAEVRRLSDGRISRIADHILLRAAA